MRLLRRGETPSTLDLLVAGLGNPGREYARHRHSVGFMVCDEFGRRHGASWRSKFSGELAELPPEGEVHVIMDNYGTHKTPTVARCSLGIRDTACTSRRRARAGSTKVERFFSKITTQRIRRGTFENVRALEVAIDRYLANHNERCKPFCVDGDRSRHPGQDQAILRTKLRKHDTSTTLLDSLIDLREFWHGS